MKSGNLNFPEPSGPVHACNGTDLPLPLTYVHDDTIWGNLDQILGMSDFSYTKNQLDALISQIYFLE